MRRRLSNSRSSNNGARRVPASASLKPLNKQLPLYTLLDQHQREAVKIAYPLEGCGLFFEQGTGKTWIAAAVVEQMASPTFSGLIIVPLTSRDSTWVEMFHRLPHIAVAHSWEEFTSLPCPRVLILHKEGIRGGPMYKGSRRRKSLDPKIRKFVWSIVVIDESQGIKDRASSISRAARFLRFQPKRLALSGTPIDKSPIDVWAQMRFIQSSALGDTWKEFTHKYCQPDGWKGKKWKFRDDMMGRFLRAIKPYCLRVTKDVLDLKPYKLVPEHIDLWGTQRQLYEDMENDMVAQFGRHTVMSQLRVVNLVRLQQITGGFVTTTDNLVFPIGEAKIRRLRRIVESHRVKPPFVVFCRFTPEVEAVEAEMKRFGFKVETLTGKTGGRDKSAIRAELNRRFQRGEIDVLVCQTRTGGVSIDLYRARQAIVYSTTFSYIDFDQIISRLHRRGQKHQVKIILLLIRNSIDTDILDAIYQKTTVATIVLNRLKMESSGG